MTFWFLSTTAVVCALLALAVHRHHDGLASALLITAWVLWLTAIASSGA
jgi:FtsH-binding integral membrane protein